MDKYFVYHNTGYYSSPVLEKFFVDYAKSIKVNLNNIKYKNNPVDILKNIKNIII